MNEPEPVRALTQFQAAMHQLDRAALLFVDYRDYLSAITLAGAADEILGQYVRDRGRTAVADDQKQLSRAGEWSHLSEKQVNDQHLNLARNFLKHKQYSEDEPRRFAWQLEAISILTRAYANATKLALPQSEPWRRYILWVMKNRPDLLED